MGMPDAKKNRDPERAVKRATADARCALRKLDLLETLESFADLDASEDRTDAAVCDAALDLARWMADALIPMTEEN